MDPDSRDIIEDHETGELSYARLDVLERGEGIDDDDRSVRQQIADLVATVVRSGDDADSMAEVINDAFIPDEPDGAGAKRALQAVLDRWWESENQESRAAIDDATARAAMRFHLAMVQTGGYNPDALIRHDAAVPQDDVESVEPEPIALEPVEQPKPVEPKPVEPKPVAVEPVDPEPVARPLTVHRSVSSMPIIDLDALDAADGTSLEGVLASMLHSLHEPAPEPAVVGASTVVAAGSADQAAGVLPVLPARQEPFDQFWATADRHPVVVGPAPRPTRGWVSTRVMLPAVGLISVGALLMAWLG